MSEGPGLQWEHDEEHSNGEDGLCWNNLEITHEWCETQNMLITHFFGSLLLQFSQK